MLRAADLFLLTTEPPESFGIVLIEAMACGLPAIATDYPGVRAVVDDGETGLLVPAGDAGAVAAALAELVDGGPAGRGPRWARRGRAKAEREWSWPRLVDRMDDAYAEAIAARRAEAIAVNRAADPARRLLLPAMPRHRRPAARRDGEVAAPARPRGHGADHVRLRRPATTPRRTSSARPTLQRLRARLRGQGLGRTRCSTPTPTAASPHPLSRVIVPEPLVAAWAPFARSRGAAAPPRAALRLRDHDLAAGVGPRGRAGAAAPRRPLGRRRPRRVDVRAAAARASRPRPSAASTGGSSAAGSARADAVVCVSEPGRRGPRAGAGSPTRS